MTLEDLTGTTKYISDFINTNPDGATDTLADADGHLRGMKNATLKHLPLGNGGGNVYS